MKCPYCNSDMKLGQIEADNLLSWKPDGEKSIGVQDGQRVLTVLSLQSIICSRLRRLMLFTAIVVKRLLSICRNKL